MATFDEIESNTETKVIAYLDAHAQIARKVAWAFVVIQILLGVLIAVGSVSSVIAAAACVLTGCVLFWLLVKTRPLSPTSLS